MTEYDDAGLTNQDDYLNTDNDKIQDMANSDAAKFNTDEQEEAVNEREETEYGDAENIDAGSAVQHNETQPPLTTQGDIGEVEENMGGTTNLSLDQLKQEGDPEGLDGE
ncbi:hypothetical protein [Mucilaginibacter sp. PAMB04168]|uniref:hypothetical protein n=1 Tax=Mucilaginibacter sp. PAMB04168 TaxID=3138567 RepID=UPI0031F6236D